MDFKEINQGKRSKFRYSVSCKGVFVACMALMCHFPVMAEGGGLCSPTQRCAFPDSGRAHEGGICPSGHRAGALHARACLLGNGTIVCTGREEEKVPFRLQRENGRLSLRSDSLEVWVDLGSYALTYKDRRTGRTLLSENPQRPREAEQTYRENVVYDPQSKRIVKTADGEKEVMDVLRRDTVGRSWKFRNHFQWAQGEALYGLGCHMEDYLDLRGKTMYLCQHNLKEMVPVLNSTAGYGLLFDAGCGMVYKDAPEGSFVELEAANEVDYYFMKGCTMDKVVAQYRYLTGQSPMFPRYMFGYIQSKERYRSSEELVDVARIPQAAGAYGCHRAGLELLASGMGVHEDGPPFLS